VLVLALIAVPLARFRPGVSRYYPLWLGVLVFTVYFNMLGTARLWIEQDRLPASQALWWVHAALLAGFAAVLVMHRQWRARRRP
jgi:lipopolysaccharide export system permease protein